MRRQLCIQNCGGILTVATEEAGGEMFRGKTRQLPRAPLDLGVLTETLRHSASDNTRSQRGGGAACFFSLNFRCLPRIKLRLRFERLIRDRIPFFFFIRHLQTVTTVKKS